MPRKSKFWPPCWPLKSAEIAPQSDAERSLFRDAMQIASKSAEVNGARALLSIQMARHMIRSTWSAPRRPNHESKFCNLKCFTHDSANATRKPKNRFWSLENPRNWAPRRLKSVQNAVQKRWCFQGGHWNSIFSKICNFSTVFGLQNEAEIEEKTLKMRCLKTMYFWIDF